MYTKKLFGKELKSKVLNKVSIHDIAYWAYSIYLEKEVEQGLDSILLTINSMVDGPEFIFTYDELNQIAADLIAGNPVNL